MSCRHFDSRPLLLALILVCPIERATADGGVVLLSRTSGARRITLFASPSPVRVGPEDFSVLLQATGSEAPVLGGQVHLILTGPDGRKNEVSLTQAKATNKILYAGNLVLPVPGKWSVRVLARDGGTDVATEGVVQVLPPEAPLATHWPFFALVPLAIGLFALHQWLQAERQRKRSSGSRKW